MTKLLIAALALPFAANAGGLDQVLARRLGGEMVIELDEGQRLVNMAWKDESDLWLLTKVAPEQEPTVYEFKESTIFGVLEGTIRVIEK